MKILITTLLCVFSGPAIAAVPAIDFIHNDWEVVCDNTRTCRAVGYHHRDDDDTQGVTVLLERAAGPGQPVTAALMLTTYNQQFWVPEVGGVAMHVDGRPLGQVRIDGDAMQGALTAAQTQALVTAVAGTGNVQWRDGIHTWTLSGSGAAAVLLKMDEAQGRIGTPGALLRKGARAESSVPAAPPMPEVSAAPVDEAEAKLLPAARSALLRELAGTLGEGDCEALNPQAISVRRLSPGKLLVFGTCWAGAAGQGIAYWVAHGTAPFKPVLVTTDGSDYRAGTIFASRSMLGCWENTERVWDGRRFTRTLEASSGRCPSIGFGSTWSLPTYVTRVTRGLR